MFDPAIYDRKYEKTASELRSFLYSKDEKYIRSLVENYGRSEEAATRLAAWDWTHGVGLYGFVKDYEATGDEGDLDVLEGWFADRLAIGLPEKNVNTVCPLLAMAFLYEKRPKEEYRRIMDEWADHVMTQMPRTELGGIRHGHAELENRGHLWDDTLFMTVLFLAKYGVLFGRDEIAEEAKYQFFLHAQYLADKTCGLWFHGWSFEERSNFAGAHWGRGNAWITVFIPDFLEILKGKVTECERRRAIGILRSQVRSLCDLQDPSGLWHTLIDDETSYLEASATAGFCYGILRSVRLGLLEEDFRPYGERALQGILENVGEDGKLENVSVGTNVGRTAEHYKKIPIGKMHYGQALAMLALMEGRTLLR